MKGVFLDYEMRRSRHVPPTAWFTRQLLVALSSRCCSGEVAGAGPSWDAGLSGFDVPRVDVAHRSVVGTGEGMIVRVTWRVPIPLAVLVVIDCAGFAVSRVRGTFGSEKRPSYADGQLEDTKPFNPKLTTTLPAVVGNSGVQGDSNSIGCRIMVDGKVNAEKVSNEVDAYTRCLVKAA